MFFPTRKLSVKTVKKIPLLEPEHSKGYWSGIPHSELIAEFKLQMSRMDWLVSNERVAVSDDEADIAIAFDLELPNAELPSYFEDLAEKDKFKFSIGIISSNARRRALTIFYGLSNGTHAVPFGTLEPRKHTSGFSLSQSVAEILESYWDAILTIEDELDNLNDEITFDETWGHMAEWCRGGVKDRFVWSKLGIMDEEMKKVVEPDNMSSWNVLLAGSQAIKTMPALKQMDVILRLKRVLGGNK